MSIVAVLEHYGAHCVPRSASWRKMRCPFHEDHHPSASVSSDANRFCCFTCGISESAAGLVKWREGGSYADAVRRAKEIAGSGDDELSRPDYVGEFVPTRAASVRPGPVGQVAAWRGRFT